MSNRQSTTQKHRTFTSEPMNGKRVTELPGVGKTLGKRFSDAGYDKAPTVLGKYLTLNQNQESFQGWAKDNFHANSKQSGDCAQGLQDWCKEFL